MKAQNRTFIVSGGSSGLGLATTQTLLESGAYVAVLDLNPPPESLVGDRTKFFSTDITSLSDIEAAVDGTVKWTQQTRARLGGVINCAGIGLPSKIIDTQASPPVPHPLQNWDIVLAVNLTGSFNLTRIALQHLVCVAPEDAPSHSVEPASERVSYEASTIDPPPEGDAERGVIIFASSSAAFEGQQGQTAYSASKGALAAMTLPMARDLGRVGVRVVSVAPGIFESAMTQRMSAKVRSSLERELVFPRRFGLPHEFAQTVKWIIECPYVNGETIRLSGGGRLPGRL